MSTDNDFGQTRLMKTKTLLWLVFSLLPPLLLLLQFFLALLFVLLSVHSCNLFSSLFMSFAKCTNKSIFWLLLLPPFASSYFSATPPLFYFIFLFSLCFGHCQSVMAARTCALIMQSTWRIRNTNHINHTPCILHINALVIMS